MEKDQEDEDENEVHCILQEPLLEELYKDLEVQAGDHFNNGIRMSKWGTNYAWKKLREKVREAKEEELIVLVAGG
jgi:hypothetical protein